MILIYDCPHCGRENEIETDLDDYTDYLEQGESSELEVCCHECESYVLLALELIVKKEQL